MKTAYRVLAYLIALEVVIQAAVIAFAVFGLERWVEGGGVLTKTVLDSPSASVTGVAGFAIHSVNGQMIMPMLAILLFVVSFFAKVDRGVLWAVIVLVTTVLQVALGNLAHAVPSLGVLHGILAIALFAVAGITGYRATARSVSTAPVGTGGGGPA